MTLLDKNAKMIQEGHRVSMRGKVTLVSGNVVTVNWDHPEKDIAGFVMTPGCLEVVPE